MTSIPMPKKRRRVQFERLVAAAARHGCGVNDTRFPGKMRYEIWKELSPGLPDDHGVICVATQREAWQVLKKLIEGSL